MDRSKDWGKDENVKEKRNEILGNIFYGTGSM